MKAPDVAGPILGFRSWTLSGTAVLRWTFADGGNDLTDAVTGVPRLLGHRVSYPTDGPLKARCIYLIGSPPGAPWDHAAPDPECRCGIYAVREAEDIPGAWPMFAMGLSTGSRVLGGIHLWGKVMPHEHGYRAEYGRPAFLLRLWDEEHEDRMQELASSYGIEIWDFPELSEGLMRAVMQEQARQFEESMQRFAAAVNAPITGLAGLVKDVQNVYPDKTRHGQRPKQPPWAAMNQPNARTAFKR